jgi:hypothetical protein
MSTVPDEALAGEFTLARDQAFHSERPDGGACIAHRCYEEAIPSRLWLIIEPRLEKGDLRS